MSARKMTLLGLAAVLITIGVIMLALADDRGGRIAGVLLVGAGLFTSAMGFMPEKRKPEPESDAFTVGNTTWTRDGGVTIKGPLAAKPNVVSGSTTFTGPGRAPRGVRIDDHQRRQIERDRYAYPDRYDDNGWLLPAFYFLYLDGFSEGYDGDPAGGEHAMYQQDQTDVVDDESPIYDGDSSDPDQGADSPAYGSESGEDPDVDDHSYDSSDVTPSPTYDAPSAPDPTPSYDSGSSSSDYSGGSSYDSGSSGSSYDSGSSGGSYDSGSSGGSYDSGSSGF